MLLAGAKQMDAVPWPPFDLRAVDFLAELSAEMLRGPDTQRQETSTTFGFWCRRARLKALAARHTSPLPRPGRGLTFHLVPANVPVLFVYTLAIDLLARNVNVVRLFSRWMEGEAPLLAALRRVLERPEHAAVWARTSLITCGRDDAITAGYCVRCDARIVWGGDTTVAAVRTMPIPPHAVELYFSDRWSPAVSDQWAFSALTPEKRGALAHRLYNDTYRMGQNAYSNPQLMLQPEDGRDPACHDRWWKVVAAEAAERCPFGPLQAARELERLCLCVMTMEEPAVTAAEHYQGNLLYVARLTGPSGSLFSLAGGFGLLSEVALSSPETLPPLLPPKTQTLACGGLGPPETAALPAQARAWGADRVVPLGRVLEMDTVWGGGDLITTPSRVIGQEEHMELFARCDRETERLLAVIEGEEWCTPGDLDAITERIARAVGEHRLVFVLCENTPETLLGYLGCLKAGEIPLLLDAHIAPELLCGLLETYHPAFVHVPGDFPAETERVSEGLVPALEVEDSVLPHRPGRQGPGLHPELAPLLTTSSSTGSPKLVRLSGRNLDANTRSIVGRLELDEDQRPVTNLVMSYSCGMSIVSTRLLAGATLVLTRRSVLEWPFWKLVEWERVTSLTGVPYTYRICRWAGLLEMGLPALNTLTQAGGKLPGALHLEFADWTARMERRFFVMYSQTEAAPRTDYLPVERVVEKCGSMGMPVPGDQFHLLGEDGAPTDASDTMDELVCRRPNMAMGHTRWAEELAPGDGWHGELCTSSIARRDGDGFYYIMSRKKRFIKLYGNQVGLDEVKRLLAARFPDTGFACVGRDNSLRIFHDSADPAMTGAAAEYLSEQIHFPERVFQIRALEVIPKDEAGKTQYRALEGMR